MADRWPAVKIFVVAGAATGIELSTSGSIATRLRQRLKAGSPRTPTPPVPPFHAQSSSHFFTRTPGGREVIAMGMTGRSVVAEERLSGVVIQVDVLKVNYLSTPSTVS